MENFPHNSCCRWTKVQYRPRNDGAYVFVVAAVVDVPRARHAAF